MRVVAWLGGVLLVACAPPAPAVDGGVSVSVGEGVTATVLLGTIDRGYGTVGLSMLALLSDEERSEWSGKQMEAEGQ